MSEQNCIVLDCPSCRTKVRAEIAGVLEYYDHEELGIRVTLAQCPCRHPLVGSEEIRGYDDRQNDLWSDPKRVWPRPLANLSSSIPQKIAESLSEAQKCLAATAYTASVAMTGRALEAIGRHFHTKGEDRWLMLAEGLEELHKNKIIDDRLYEWGKALHENRNLAAHASDQVFDRDDAEDLFNFAVAICEYVFVLSEKFADFKERQSNKKKSKKADTSESET